MQTHNRNYTVDDFEEMFSDMGYNIGRVQSFRVSWVVQRYNGGIAV